MRVLSLLMLLIFSLPALAAERLPVVASFSLLADLVREVGGEHVEVTSLVGPDEDAHVHEPSPADVQRLREARLVVANGLGFEPWLARLVASSETRAPVVQASRGVVPRMLDEEGVQVPDPHAWNALANAEIYVRNIATALAEADPAHAPDYRAREADYLRRVHALLAEAERELGALAARHPRVVTSHDAFGYLGQAYGIAFVAPQGLSTEREPSAAEVAALIRQIRAEGIDAVFVENIKDARLLRQIAEESGARIGGTLYSDALAAEGEASSYLGLYRHNLRTLVEALGR